ncbi:alpha/beta hydrolase fold domain-containing protein [Corynebacterium caspium]|uniref:alpha/beta hydrolase fold domain-containing protein n=1 Tax=Corynebacterium caspium TaxID=234828 RepID=UPI0003745ECF|nr:alpha/beta hydrolase fold domain-containing protein [Corynebacterium caspium]
MNADDKHRSEFRIGGHESALSPEAQLEQLATYIDANYPLPDFTPPWAGGSGDPGPADRWSAKLPDRITHTAMLMLGAGLDHSMPGSAFAQGIAVENCQLPAPAGEAAIFHPSSPSGAWAISLHSGGWWRGAGEALEFQWRPEVAAAAELSGTTILDLDYPLAPAHSLADMVAAIAKAKEFALGSGARSISLWGYSSGAALAAIAAGELGADSLVLTFPDLASVAKLPDAIRAGYSVPALEAWPVAHLVQVASEDEVAADPQVPGAVYYPARHRISTPAVARQKIQDIADFLAAVPSSNGTS